MNPNEKNNTDESTEQQTVPPRPGFLGNGKRELGKPGNTTPSVVQNMSGISAKLPTMLQRGPIHGVNGMRTEKEEVLLEEEPRKPRIEVAELATKDIAERLELAKQREGIKGKTGNEIGKESESEGKKCAKLILPDSDLSAKPVKIISTIPGGKLPIERRPERVKEGDWEIRPVSKRKVPNVRSVAIGRRR
jgi:hypothetical protein